MGSERIFVGRIRFRAIAKVGRIRGVWYSGKTEDKDKDQ